MKTFLHKVSLLQSLIVMIVIALIVPIPVATLIYVNSTFPSKQEDQNTLNTKKFDFSSAIFAESLWNYYPELGQTMLDQLLLDQNIQFVRVRDNDEKLFLMWESPQQNPGDTLVLRKVLQKDDVAIGTLEMGFKRIDLIESILKDMRLFGSMILLQILFLVSVISLIYYYKVLKPIKRLVAHSHLLAAQKLDEPFEWEENDEIGLLGHSLDQTRIKLQHLFKVLQKENERLDEKVKQRTQELEDASRYKSEFLANMSHEIRTPMNAVMGMSHLLGKTAMSPVQQNYVSKIKEASSLLLRIINDILDFSKIEAGKMDVEVVAFDLHKELKKSCSIFSVLAKEKNIDFQCDFIETNRFFRGDPHKIMQIVNNFLSNAIKFTSEGGVFLSVCENVLAEERSSLCFSVKDSGIGIAKEKQNLLFQAFSQVDASVTRKHGGTGLGLYICAQLAQMMHAEISFTSEEGRGSLFSFTIPLGVAKGIDLHSDSSNDRSSPLHIVLIEDYKKTADYFNELVRSFGFFMSVMKSKDAIVEALQSAQSPYDVLVIDHELSRGKNGLALYASLLKETSVTLPPTIMFSMNDDAAFQANVKASGINVLLKKPINASMLYDELVSLCTMHTKTPLFDPSKIDLSKKRILVVEDNEINLDVAVYLLKETHAQVDTARNGLEAVEKLQECSTSYDLILMDVQMPIMDGFEATRMIRKELDILTPIVAMTANVMVQDIEKCLKAGMDAHIGKPFEVEDFYGTLLETLHVSSTVSPKHQTAGKAKYEHVFDPKEAIARLGGNETLWRKILSRFYETFTHMPQKIASLSCGNDRAMCVDYVHTQKGLCGTLGLFALEHALLEAETLLKTDRPIEPSCFDGIIVAHRNAAPFIDKEYESFVNNTALRNPSSIGNEAGILEQKQHLQALHEALEHSNVSKVHALLETLMLDADLKEDERFTKLSLACKQFDFDAALAYLQELRQEKKYG